MKTRSLSNLVVDSKGTKEPILLLSRVDLDLKCVWLTIFSQIDWRKAKKEKIHRMYDEYRKPNFPREIQASKLDESGATKLP